MEWADELVISTHLTIYDKGWNLILRADNVKIMLRSFFSERVWKVSSSCERFSPNISLQKFSNNSSLSHFPVLVLVFVVYSRRRESHIKYPGPDDDVRENIINYDDEGGGEDDMTAFDITPLQIPIGGPMPDMQCKMQPLMCKFGN